jgi:hypothetical protein
MKGKGCVMAANFRIFVHRNSENLHLKLIGDFDGLSAYELLDVIRRNSFGASKVFIHTGSLEHAEQMGKNVFRNNLGPAKTRPFLVFFTGNHACQLPSEGSQICSLDTRNAQGPHIPGKSVDLHGTST